MLLSVFYLYAIYIIICFIAKGLVTNYGDGGGGGATQPEGRACEVLPLTTRKKRF